MNSKSIGTPLTTIGIVFVALKLCGIVAWSWWWVTAPFWGLIAIGISVLVIGLAAAYLMEVISEWRERRADPESSFWQTGQEE